MTTIVEFIEMPPRVLRMELTHDGNRGTVTFTIESGPPLDRANAEALVRRLQRVIARHGCRTTGSVLFPDQPKGG